MRKALTALGLLMLILGLLCFSGCGNVPEGMGRYLCVRLSEGELPLDAPESVLLLDRGGYARIVFGEESGAAFWEMQDGQFHLTVDGTVYSGTLADGVLRLSAGTLTFVFVREDLVPAFLAEAETENTHRAQLQALWEGDWYGYWQLDSEEGLLEDAWYDCCAKIRSLPEGGLYLLLWDEDSSAAQPFAKLRLLPEDGGLARTTDGRFWFETSGEAALLFRLEDGVLRCDGIHDANGERFSFSLVMRRWGDKWDSEEQTPYYRDDWYLPLIRSGAGMPDRMTIIR